MRRCGAEHMAMRRLAAPTDSLGQDPRCGPLIRSCRSVQLFSLIFAPQTCAHACGSLYGVAEVHSPRARLDGIRTFCGVKAVGSGKPWTASRHRRGLSSQLSIVPASFRLDYRSETFTKWNGVLRRTGTALREVGSGAVPFPASSVVDSVRLREHRARHLG